MRARPSESVRLQQTDQAHDPQVEHFNFNLKMALKTSSTETGCHDPKSPSD